MQLVNYQIHKFKTNIYQIVEIHYFALVCPKWTECFGELSLFITEHHLIFQQVGVMFPNLRT